jgi:glycyl-tRNA synthetase alpha chain
MEITQFTYFQLAGGIRLDPVCVELTYGLERIAMYLQEKESVYDLMWNDNVTYGDVHRKGEWELSVYSFELADVDMLLKMFGLCEQESLKISEEGIVLPAYDYCLKCSHLFNILEARGAISVTERTHYIDRIRNLARLVAKNYLAQREEMGFPLMNRG